MTAAAFRLRRVAAAWCPPRAAAVMLAAAVAALAGCASSPTKEEIEAAKNTYTCQWSGERLVIRFAPGEARMLMPGGERITLYQIASASGVRYTNGLLELRGKGTDLSLVNNGELTRLDGCEQMQLPK